MISSNLINIYQLCDKRKMWHEFLQDVYQLYQMDDVEGIYRKVREMNDKYRKDNTPVIFSLLHKINRMTNFDDLKNYLRQITEQPQILL